MPRRRWTWRQKWMPLAVLSGVVAFAALLVQLHSHFAASRVGGPAMSTLAAAVGPIRPVQGRLVGGFAYAPFQTVPHLATADSQVRAAYRGAYDMARRDDAMGLHDLAQLELLAAKPQRAIRLLERAAARSPAAADIRSDLASAYLELDRQKPRAAHALAALESADLAVEADPQLPEARFNRAIAFERLYLDGAALDEWRHFLDLDSQSSWAQEARDRLFALQARLSQSAGGPARLRGALRDAALRDDGPAVHALVSGDPQAAREAVEDDLLPAWAAAGGRRGTAPALLTAAQRIAHELAVTAGDRFLDEVIASAQPVGKPANERDGAATDEATAALGLEKLADGHRKLRSHQIAAAVSVLQEAAQRLDQANSPAALLARLHLASCAHQRNQVAKALAILRPLADDSRLGRYPSLAARLYWMIGLVEVRRGEGARALAAYDRALRLFQGLGDRAGAATIECLLAEELDLLGQPQRAWDHRYRALSWTAGHTEGTVAYNILDDAVVALLHARRPGLALPFQTRLAGVAEALGQPEERSLTHLRRARVLHALGRVNEAEDDLDRAEADLSGIDPAPRAVIHAEVSLVRSELVEPQDPRRAIAELTRAIDFHRRGGLAPLLPELLCQRARRYQATGELDAAAHDLELGIAELERQRRLVDLGRDSIPLFDQAEPLFGTLLALQLERGQDEQAFVTAERFRARLLLDRWPPAASRSSAEPLSREEISARLPRGTTLIEFAAVSGRLVTWLCDGDRLIRIAGAPAFVAIARHVEALQEALLVRDRPRTEACLKWLHHVLIAPWQGAVAAEETLVFIPTGPLHAVPFAALLDAASGRFLVQDHPEGVAPSATAYVHALARAHALGAGAPTRVLVVAEPRLPAPTAGDEALPYLPAAAAEARSVASLYPASQLLLGDAATRNQVLAALPASEVVHFTTHAVDVDDPSRARLLLTGDDGSGASLTADEVSQLELTHARLVVLAACSTSAGRASASEGPLSLAHAFEAAGVPAVLSTLWAVEDEPAARLFVRFHTLLRSGLGPLRALRAAQLEELARQAPGWTWAALELVGGFADENAAALHRG